MQLTDQDRKLLRLLQHSPDLNTAELAEELGISAALCARRLDRLRDTGVIQKQRAIINWSALGYTVEVSLRVSLDKTNPSAFDEFLASARTIPEVLEIQTFLGRVDVRLHLIATDMGHYQAIYRERVLSLPHIAEIEALMQVASIHERGELPI